MVLNGTLLTAKHREISLLIESDGHPNVVRYFLKETKGEFVYLALELCDMSLDELIASLGKLRPSRKRSIGDSDGLEEASKSLLFQIATGVRHSEHPMYLFVICCHCHNNALSASSFTQDSPQGSEATEYTPCAEE